MKNKLKNAYKLLIILMVSFSHSLIAVSGVWNSALPGIWNLNANWFPNTGFPNASDQCAGFIGSPTAAIGNTIDSTTNITIGELHVNIPTGENLTIQFTPPNRLIFASSQGGARFMKSGTGLTTINTPITLNATLSVFFDNGSIDLSSNTTGDVVLSGVISGNNGLSLIGNTQPSLNDTHLVLQATNTYIGSTTVSGGILSLNSPGGGAVPSLFVGQGGRLETLLNNQFTTSTFLNLQTDFVADLKGTTQSVRQLNMSEATFIDSVGSGVLQLNAPAVAAIFLLNHSVLNIPTVTIIAGRITAVGHSSMGDPTLVNTFTLNIPNNTTVDVGQVIPTAENNDELVIYNPVIPSGSINYNLGGNGGTLAFTGNHPANTVTTLNINFGQVIAGLQSTDVIACSGDTTVLTGGILLGFGTYSSDGFSVINQGLVEPGDNVNPGTLTLNGFYDQQGGSLSIKAPTAATAAKLVVNGIVTLNGGSLFFEGDNLAVGDSIVVIDNTAGPINLAGTFANFVPSINSNPALKAELVYTPKQVIVRITDGSCAPLPPTNLRAHEFKNKFLTETDHIIQLKWSASETPGVVSYNIYRNGKKIGNVKANQPLEFNDHDRSTDRTYVYEVKAVNGAGVESVAATVIVKKKRRHSSSDSGHFEL